MNRFALALRMLRRNSRSGEARVLLLALFIAVMSVSTVAFFADRVELALNQRANELIAADVVVITDKPVSARFRETAERLKLATASSTTFPSMVADDKDKGQGVSLAELKAITPGFPLRGQFKIADRPGTEGVATRDIPAPGTVWVPEVLLTRLDARVGDTLKIGATKLVVAAVLVKEPDSVLDYFGIAPRLMLNMRDLPATELLQVGSRATFRFMVAGEIAAVEEFRAAHTGNLLRGERIESVRDSRSEVRVALERAQRFLGLAALLSVVLASVAVALAARRFSRRQLDSAAMMRCLGASRADIFILNLWQFLLLALVACATGTLAGFAAQSVLSGMLAGFLSVALPMPSIVPAIQACAIGLALLFGFTLPPLLALRKVPTLRVLRRDLDPFDSGAALAYLLGFATLACLIVWRAGEIKLGAIAVGGFVAALAVAALAGWLLILAAARLRGATSGSWRYGIANMRRRSGGSLVQVMALGVGIMAMLMLTLVRTDMIGRWQGTLKDDMPNRFVINIQSDQLPAVKAYFAGRSMTTPDLYPMVKGRLTAINDVAVVPSMFKDERAKRTSEREFNLSWATALQPDNKVVAGEFWPTDAKDKQFSVEEGIAKTLGIKVGDVMSYDIAGSTFSAKVTSLRKVEWDSFKANFFVLGTPAALDNYPASYITSFHLKPGNEAVVAGLIRQFPNLSVIDMTAIMNQVRAITNQVADAVSFVFVFALAAGLVVLYAAIATTQDERVFEAAIMRTLGASRRQMVVVQLAEFLVIGLLSGLIASGGALALATVLSDKVLGLPYSINYWIPVIGIFGGGVGIAAAGLLGTQRAVSTPPLATIRALE